MSDYDFVIRLKPKMQAVELKKFSDQLILNGFELRLFPEGKIEAELAKGERMLFLRYCDFTYLLKKAEQLKLSKRMMSQFLEQDYLCTDDIGAERAKKSLEAKGVDTQERRSEKFRSIKMEQFISIKPHLPDQVNRMENYRRFKFSERAKFSKEESDEAIFTSLFTPSEQLMIKREVLDDLIGGAEEGHLIDAYRELGLVHNPIPLHQRSQKPSDLSVSSIRSYFGDNIAIYFEFVEFFQKKLIPLVVIGVLVGVLNDYFDFDSNKSPFDSLYSVIVIIWASYFAATWKKYENQQEILNCSHSVKQLKKTNKLIIPKVDQEKFKLKVDFTTGQKDYHFPTNKRIIKYILSALQLFPFIAMAITTLIVSLNVRGYVDPLHRFLFIEPLYLMSQEGGFFDKKVWYLKLLATILHVNIFQKLNSFYRERAERTSKAELHSTVVKRNNSVVFKRFLFEMLYTFTDLSYIAFVRFDIEALKSELIAIYSADEIRRVMTEAVIPYFTKLKFRMKQEQEKANATKKSDEQVVSQEYFADVLLEIALPKYEQFDDYLEIVINFGYISLFAAAFPYAPLLVFCFNAIELFSDKRKLNYLYQRPAPLKISGIGIWNLVLNFMGIMCVITNIILFSFSSDQISEFFPQLFFYKSPDQQQQMQLTLQHGGYKFIILIVFVLEHLLFIGIYLLRKFIKSRDDWTTIYHERQEYYHKIKYISHEHQDDDEI